jgi:sulfatase maturation enzyme AslB (radical SAM superfamily)
MKILCLGNNTLDTDSRCRALAQSLGIDHRGIVREFDHDVGVWHTSVMDLSRSEIISLSQQADRAIMLAQPMSEWSHPDAWLRTVEIIDEVKGEFQDQDEITRYRYWQQVLVHNPSFCILPWVEHMTRNDYAVLCCRSHKPVTKSLDVDAWTDDPGYQTIRTDMIQGRPRPDHCSVCYQQEAKSIWSDRHRETLEWTNRLKLDNLEDLASIQKPVYFEMRASNKCNLKCRMCGPDYSHLIAHERKVMGILPMDYHAERNNNRFENIPMDHVQKLYVAGGEPLIMPEFLGFLRRARQQNHMDLELVINTNCTTLTTQFQEHINGFSNVTFIVSIDGIGDVNDYIRSNSKWSAIVKNLDWICQNEFSVSLNTVVSVYNAARVHEIFEFLDHRFPNLAVNLVSASSPGNLLDPLHHPRRDQVKISAHRALMTRSVDNGPGSRQWLLSFLQQIETHQTDSDAYQTFFQYNDQLDRHRGTNLSRVLPELIMVDQESR